MTNVIGNILSFTSQIVRVIGSLEANLNFCNPLGFDIQRNSDHETPKIKLYFDRALKRYPNEKILIHGRVKATISKFGAQILKRALVTCGMCKTPLRSRGRKFNRIDAVSEKSNWHQIKTEISGIYCSHTTLKNLGSEQDIPWLQTIKLLLNYYELSEVSYNPSSIRKSTLVSKCLNKLAKKYTSFWSNPPSSFIKENSVLVIHPPT